MPRKTRRAQRLHQKRKQSRRGGSSLTAENIKGLRVLSTTGSEWDPKRMIGNASGPVPANLEPNNLTDENVKNLQEVNTSGSVWDPKQMVGNAPGPVPNALQPGKVGPDPPEEKANGYWAYLYRMLLGDLEPVDG